MDYFAGIDSLWLLGAACLAALLGGLIKGAVGFALPMVMISLLSSILPPNIALAAVIMPALVSNGVQGLRQGGKAALASVLQFRVYLGVGLLALLVSAQVFVMLPQRVLFLMIGGPIALFTFMQLIGWKPRLAGQSMRAEILIGGFAGFVGGMSGVWGPPTVAYLTAINTPKQEQMRVQGVIYGLGAVALTLAHLQSGVLNAKTIPFSVLMVVPALLGMWLGFRVHDRIDQATFRRATLFVLLIAGLNLIRRGVFS